MKSVGLVLLFGLLLGWAGCGGESPKPTKVPMPPAGKKEPPSPAPTVGPLPGGAKPEPAPVRTYSYKPQGKADPFRPLVVERAAPPPPAKVVEPVREGATPLEKMDLAQLKLVAVIWNVREPKGLVEDPGGKGYIVGVGTAVGKNGGKVTQITSTGMIVTEKQETSPGKFKNREVSLMLYPD